VAVANAPEDGRDTPPLSWFGPEVSADPAYQRRRLALDGHPDTLEVDLSNAALASLLDLLEDRFTTWPVHGQAAEPDAPAADASPRAESRATKPDAKADDEIDALGIEDAVTRELARSLQPRRADRWSPIR